MSWPLRPLGEFMAARRAMVDPSRFPDESFQLFSIPAFDDGQPECLTGSEIGSAKQIVQTGDVLFSRIVPHIRRAWVVGPSNGTRQVGSGEWIVFSSPLLHPAYLRHFLTSDGFHSQIARTLAGVGGSLMRARASEVAKICVPFPPLEEQKRIAAILDKADGVRRKRGQAVQLAGNLLVSVFRDMFGDPARNPRGWTRVAFAELLSLPLRNGISPSSDGTIRGRVLTLSAITGESFRRDASKEAFFGDEIRPDKLVDPRDFLICRGNGNVGLVGKAKFPEPLVDTVFPDTMIAARIGSSCDGHYLSTLWDTPYIRQQIERGARTTNGTYKINQQVLESIEIPLPPLELQQQFVHRGGRIVTVRHRMQAQAADCLAASLADKAFSGLLESTTSVVRPASAVEGRGEPMMKALIESIT